MASVHRALLPQDSADSHLHVALQQLPEGCDSRLPLQHILHQALDLVLPLLKFQITANLLNLLQVQDLTGLLAGLHHLGAHEKTADGAQLRPVAVHEVLHEPLQTRVRHGPAALQIQQDVLYIWGQEVGHFCQAGVLQAASFQVQGNPLEPWRHVLHQKQERLVNRETAASQSYVDLHPLCVLGQGPCCQLLQLSQLFAFRTVLKDLPQEDQGEKAAQPGVDCVVVRHSVNLSCHSLEQVRSILALRRLDSLLEAPSDHGHREVLLPGCLGSSTTPREAAVHGLFCICEAIGKDCCLAAIEDCNVQGSSGHSLAGAAIQGVHHLEHTPESVEGHGSGDLASRIYILQNQQEPTLCCF
mmetsp:Transcript_124396/g.295224  ORF Transcript_124396/g.295224 Transcript_124396/m.295224 type:complete len:357 (-) Transcript_124396:192-1262(-)